MRTFFFLLISILIYSCNKNDSKLIEPTNTNYGILNDNTIIVSSDSLGKSLISVDSTHLVFRANGVGVDKIKVGTILVSDVVNLAPFGYLRRVIKVNNIGGNKVCLTEQATVVEALKEGKVNYDKSITNTDIKAKDISGLDISEEAENVIVNDPNLSFELGFNETRNGINLKGQSKLEADFHFELDVKEFEVNNFVARTTIKNTNSSSFSSVSKTTVNWQKVIATYEIKPILIMIGPFPLVLRNYLVIVVGINGKLEAKITTSLRNKNDKTLGIQFIHKSWKEIKDASSTTQVETPYFEGVASCSAWIQERFEVRPYGLKDVRMSLAAKAGPNLNISTTTQNSCEFKIKVDWLANLAAKAQMKVFKKLLLDFDAEIYQAATPIYDTTIKPIITDTAFNIKANSADISGVIINIPTCSNNIIERGFCYALSPNPTISNNVITNGSGTGSFSSKLNNLEPKTTYYIRAYAKNRDGIVYGNERIFKTRKYLIGDTAFGGIIFYFNDTNNAHGLVCSLTEIRQEILPMPSIFNAFNIPAVNGTDTSIGSGFSNTNKIISIFGNSSVYAANACRDFKGGGFVDWFLPSAKELEELCKQKSIVAANQDLYWHSTIGVVSTRPMYSQIFAMFFENNYDCNYWNWLHVHNAGNRPAIRACRKF